MPILLDVGAKADTGSFKQIADQADKWAAGAGKSASGAFSKAFADGAKDVRKSEDVFTKAYDAIATSAGKAKTAESERQRQLSKSESLVKAATKAEEDLAKARDAGDTKAAAAAERELERVRDQQARTATALIRSSESLSQVRRDEARQVRDAIAAYRQLEDSQRRAATPGLNRSFDSYNKGQGGVFGGALSQSSGIVGQFQSIGGSAGKGFVAGAAAAIIAGGLIQVGAKAADMVIGGFKSVMDTGIDFSKTVNEFQGVTQSSAIDTQQMAAAARALGADTTLAGVSSADAAAAMTELAKAGFSVDDAIGAARGTMQLATAAQIDGAQAAEVQANAINAFGLSAKDAAHVADVLANAAVGSSADIPDLALALQQVGGISKGFGENIEDTAAALGMFANAGIKGSDAGTLLKTTMQSITDQGNPAQGAIQALGLSLYNFGTGQFVGFRELFRQLDEAKQRMSPQAFQANANVLFGTDAMRAAMLGNVQSFDTMVSTINRVGTAGDMAKAKMQGWPGVVEGVKNSIGELKLSLYDIVDTPAGKDFGKKLVDGASGLVEWVRTHKPEIISFVTDFVSAFATGADAFLTYVARMLEAGSYLQDALSHTFGTALEGVAKLAQGVGSVIKYIPGVGMAIGPKLEGAGKAVDDIVDKWQNLGTSMRAGADGIDHLREGIRNTRDEFTAAAMNAIASEEANRRYAASFKEVSGSIQQIPGTKDFVIKDNSPQVLEKLRSLGFAVNNLPDGRQVIRIDYRDSAGNPLSPEQVSKMLGYNTQSFASAGDAQRARRGLDYNTPAAAAAIAAAAPPPPTVGAPGSGTLPGGSSGGGGKQNPKFDESLWRVPVPGFVASAGIPGVADPQKVYDAQTAELNARDNLEQSKLKLLQLESDNTTDQLALISAKNQVQENERAWTKAQRELIDAQNGTLKNAQSSTKSLADGMGQLGAALDDDFGISKGFSGIVENFVKAAGNILAAPFLQALGLVAKAKPNEGSGLIGFAAANGAFGPQYTAQGTNANGGGFTAYGLPQGLVPTRLSDTGRVPSGPQSRTAAALIEQIFGNELRGTIGGSRDTNTAKNTHDAGLSIDIPIGPDQMGLGDRINAWLQQNAGALGLEYSIWRDKGQYPGGGGFNQPGHQNHIDAHFDGKGGQLGALSASTNSPVPVNVVNSSDMAIGSDQSSIAKAIYSAFTGAGYSPQSAMTAVQAGLLESGLNPAAMNSSGHNSIFQTSADKGVGSDPASQINWALAEAGRQGGPAAMNADPGNFWANNVERGGYPGSMYDSFAPRATALVGADPTLPVPGSLPGGGGVPGTGVPQSAPFGGPSGITFGSPFAGQAGAAPGLGAGAGGVSPPSNPQGGQAGLSGAPMDALMGAASGLDALMPGAGAVAKIGIQEINRAIEFGGQVAGIGASAIGEILSVGDNPRGSLGASWFGKLAGGLAGARPALPNMAGQKPPGAPQAQPGQGPAGQTVNNTVNLTNQKASEDQNGRTVAEHVGAMYAPAGRQ